MTEYITYGSLLAMAVAPIYIGSWLQLKDQSGGEELSVEDAMWFPIMGSGVLFGLYLLFKYVASEYLDLLITAYFGMLAVAAVHSTFHGMFIWDGLRRKVRMYHPSIRVPLLMSKPWKPEVSVLDIPAGILSLGVAVWYVTTRHWLANNVVALAFSVQGVQLISLGSYKVGCVLLGGLFFYDIFWVFGTPVMLTVAKQFQAPIKVLFPRDIFAETYEFSLLGLGDIVLPGIFLAMLLRYDRYRAAAHRDEAVVVLDAKPFRSNLTDSTVDILDEAIADAQAEPTLKPLAAPTSFSTPFFHVGLLFYVLGLITTIAVMVYFKSGQPALLYLVPACIGSSLLLAIIRGEWVQLMQFTSSSTPPAMKKQSSKSGKKSRKSKRN